MVIYNSSAFPMDPQVPLVIPKINADAIAGHHVVIANPNCAAVALMAVAPIHRSNRIRRRTLATYQAGSGAGAAAMAELEAATRAYLSGESFTRGSCRTLMPSTCSATTPPLIRRLATTTRRPR